MRIVTLIPLSKRAKQIIKQHGERWEAIRLEQRADFEAGTATVDQTSAFQAALAAVGVQAETGCTHNCNQGRDCTCG